MSRVACRGVRPWPVNRHGNPPTRRRSGAVHPDRGSRQNRSGISRRCWPKSDSRRSDLPISPGAPAFRLRNCAAISPRRSRSLPHTSRRPTARCLPPISATWPEEPARERLFDVLMRRLEMLGPHREAVRSLLRSARRNPPLAFALNGLAIRSQQWMLTAAGIEASGPRGLLRAQGLAVLFASVLRTWVHDDDPGLARTMAALDRALGARSAPRGLPRRSLPHSGAALPVGPAATAAARRFRGVRGSVVPSSLVFSPAISRTVTK